MDHWNGIIFLIFQGFGSSPVYPSQEYSLWNSLHFYVDLKGSTQNFQEISAKYFVLLPFWFCENLLGFTLKDNRITWEAYKFAWKASLNFEGLVEAWESSEIPKPWFQSSDPLKREEDSRVLEI